MALVNSAVVSFFAICSEAFLPIHPVTLVKTEGTTFPIPSNFRFLVLNNPLPAQLIAVSFPTSLAKDKVIISLAKDKVPCGPEYWR